MEQQDLWTRTQSQTDPAAKHIMVLHANVYPVTWPVWGIVNGDVLH